MLSARTDKILKFIVLEYILKATPVPSQNISHECNLGVSPATVRHEMALLEQAGYITRPHTSAGAVPADKGYRYYVNSLRDIKLPPAEMALMSHLFHQVERRLEEWLGLAATLIARSSQNVALVTMPKPADCQFKRLELIYLQDNLVLVILILRGIKIKKELINFDHLVDQSELTAISNRFNIAYASMNRLQIKSGKIELNTVEQQMANCLIKMMQEEDAQEYEAPYLAGWHFMLSQPEFAHSQRMAALIELVEQRQLLKAINPPKSGKWGVEVTIGSENKVEAIHEYSIVLSQYGLPNEASGTIGLLGPTRMPYARAIPTVDYLSSVLSELMTSLYGKEKHTELSSV